MQQILRSPKTQLKARQQAGQGARQTEICAAIILSGNCY